ncbi:thiamine phosphate synthase [Methanocalculus sp.]|uniref:thiamine phosphate synthase n=1 Tax=Methanocalculus sp. TaxID=2004547 RepID=UPI0026337CAA|nr:thiamine phosphate synthase [Methanocalculus sp.]MDG6251415.1 thiamine phosphate synthase [Methanocalculus sp.]
MAYDLYVITDEQIGRGRSHTELARMALLGGADIIQLRDKRMDAASLYRTATEILAMTRDAGACFIMNDRLDIALATGADGVHLGQQDMPISEARRIVPRDFIIGSSVGSVDEAIQAEISGADYLALSPVFATTSKDDAGCGHGLSTLGAIRAATRLPLVAIGGITWENIGSVIGAGADGAAVISAVVGEEDVAAAAAELKRQIAVAKNPGRTPPVLQKV